jgi:hypothetical protein
VPWMWPIALADATSVPPRNGDLSSDSGCRQRGEKRLNLLGIERFSKPCWLIGWLPGVLRHGVLALCFRPLQLSLRTVSCLASDTRNIDKTFSRTANSTLTAMGSSFAYFLSAAATQMVRFVKFDRRCPELTLCFRAVLLSKTRRWSSFALRVSISWQRSRRKLIRPNVLRDSAHQHHIRQGFDHLQTPQAPRYPHIAAQSVPGRTIYQSLYFVPSRAVPCDFV